MPWGWFTISAPGWRTFTSPTGTVIEAGNDGHFLLYGADGALVGFGGGLPVKEFLLRLEGALPAQQGGLF